MSAYWAKNLFKILEVFFELCGLTQLVHPKWHHEQYQ